MDFHSSENAAGFNKSPGHTSRFIYIQYYFTIISQLYFISQKINKTQRISVQSKSSFFQLGEQSSATKATTCTSCDMWSGFLQHGWRGLVRKTCEDWRWSLTQSDHLKWHGGLKVCLHAAQLSAALLKICSVSCGVSWPHERRGNQGYHSFSRVYY